MYAVGNGFNGNAIMVSTLARAMELAKENGFSVYEVDFDPVYGVQVIECIYGKEK